MAVQTKTYPKSKSRAASTSRRRQSKPKKTAPVSASFIRLLPGWVILAFVLLILLPNALAATLGAAGRVITQLPRTLNIASTPTSIAPFFTPTVAYWDTFISRWAGQYQIDPNLLATIMQIDPAAIRPSAAAPGRRACFR